MYSYLVDLATMMQTNHEHPAHTSRHIRRWTPPLGNDETPPGAAAGCVHLIGYLSIYYRWYGFCVRFHGRGVGCAGPQACGTSVCKC